MDMNKGQTGEATISKAPRNFLSPLADRPVVSSFVVGLLALVVRLDLLFRDYPLSFDDGVYAMSIDHVTDGQSPFGDVFSSQGGYFLTLISVPARIFGDSFWSFRLVPLLTGIFLAIATMFVARRFTSTSFAFLAGISVALSGTAIRTTTPITSDSLVALAALCVVLLTYFYLSHPRISRALLLGAAIGLGCGIKSIFMIPTLIFVLVVTWRTSWWHRIAAAITSVVIFAIPFALFGITDTLDQSVFYHLDKTDSLDVADNISKITSTYFSFDLALSVLAILATISACMYVVKTRFFRRTSARDFFSRIFDIHHPLSYLLFVFLPTLLMLVVQAPLFRNHLVLLIPCLAVYTFWLLDKFFASLHGHASTVGLILVSLILVSGSWLSITAVYQDSLVVRNRAFDEAVKTVKIIPRDGLILTNEPGVAWAAQRDVPIGLEDTSRYRFSTTRDSIALNEDVVREFLANDNVCAIVASPEHIPPIIDFEQVAPSSWVKVLDKDFVVWINPSFICQA
jgi:4-amino-4-deoxy-L-arabinose transferase-like glycosyltransferase